MALHSYCSIPYAQVTNPRFSQHMNVLGLVWWSRYVVKINWLFMLNMLDKEVYNKLLLPVICGEGSNLCLLFEYSLKVECFLYCNDP